MMNIHTATEQAYKNGYAQGKSDAASESFREILHIIRNYSHSALIAKNDYGAMQAEYIGVDILELKKKYTEGQT